MYNDKTVTLLALSPDGTLREIIAEQGDTLDAMYAAIGCRAVDVIRLPRDVDMWVDDEYLLVENPAENRFAGALIDLLSDQRVGAIVMGTVVLASTNSRGDTVSLDDATRTFVLGLVLSFGGRRAPTMRPVQMEGGRAWEWEYHGVQFRAESHNGSSLVVLHFRTDAPDSEWTFSHNRDTEGGSAKRVAEDMYRDTTGVAL